MSVVRPGEGTLVWDTGAKAPIAAGVACDVIQFVHGDFSAGMSGGP